MFRGLASFLLILIVLLASLATSQAASYDEFFNEWFGISVPNDEVKLPNGDIQITNDNQLGDNANDTNGAKQTEQPAGDIQTEQLTGDEPTELPSGDEPTEQPGDTQTEHPTEDEQTEQVAPAAVAQAAPSVPTGLMVTAAGDRRVELSWNASNPNDGSNLVYEVSYKRSTDPVSAWTVASTSSATSRTVTNLTNWTLYNFRVRARTGVSSNAYEFSGYSSIVSEKPKVPPSVPTGLRATLGDRRVDFVWNESNPNGGPNLAYEFSYKRSEDEAWITLPVVYVTTITVTGIVNGTSYDFRVRARTGANSTEYIYSNYTPIVKMTPMGNPSVPTGLKATPGDRRVELVWNESDPNGGAGLVYEVSYKRNSEAEWITLSLIATTSRTVTGLANGTLYDFRVRARTRSVSGEYYYSAYSSIARATPYGIPSVPTRPTAAPGDKRVEFSWPASDPNGGVNLVYEVQYKRNVDAVWIDAATNANTSRTITGLVNGTVYNFRVRARTGPNAGVYAYSVYTNPVNAIPRGNPSTPTGLTASPGNSRVNLSWNASDANGGANLVYEFEYKRNADTEWITLNPSAVTSRFVSSVINGTAYSFRVRARTGVNQADYLYSNYSAIVYATPG